MFRLTRSALSSIPSCFSRPKHNCVCTAFYRPLSTGKETWSNQKTRKDGVKNSSNRKERTGNTRWKGEFSDREHSGKERGSFASRGKDSQRGFAVRKEHGSYAARDNYNKDSGRAEFWGENSKREHGSYAKHGKYTNSRHKTDKASERKAPVKEQRAVVEAEKVPWGVETKPLSAEIESGTEACENSEDAVIERPSSDQNHGIEWFRKTNRDREEGDILFGLSVVLAALETKQRKFKQMWIRIGIENTAIGEKDHFARILARAAELNIPIRRASGHVIELLAPDRVHQGIILETLPLDLIPLISLGPVDHEGASYELNPPDGANIEQRKYTPPAPVWPIWLALDQVTDPQNFGSIARSAQFFGVDGIVVCHKNSAPRSAVASKASTGALEVMDLHVVNNLHNFLKKCSANGWHIIGASAPSSEAETRQHFRPSHIALPKSPVLPNRPTDSPITGPIILVVGSEGEGLRPHVLAECKEIMCIQGLEEISQGRVRVPGMTSLNVGVATGCLLRELTQIRDRPLRSGTTIDKEQALEE